MKIINAKTKTMCTCFSDKQTALTARMLEVNPNSSTIESVKFTTQKFDPETGVMVLYLPVTGIYKTGVRTKQFQATVKLTYCPFCGEAYS